MISQPVVKFTKNPDSNAVLRDIESSYRTAVFVSATGVGFFIDILQEAGLTLSDWAKNHRIAAIGPGTAESLIEAGLSVDLIPPEFNSVSLAKELADRLPDPYLLIRANRGSRELGKILAAADKSFIELPVYISNDVQSADASLLQMLHDQEIGWVTMTSPAIAESTVRLFANPLKQTRVICISENVATVARDYGCGNVWVANAATFESMASEMVSADSQ